MVKSCFAVVRRGNGCAGVSADIEPSVSGTARTHQGPNRQVFRLRVCSATGLPIEPVAGSKVAFAVACRPARGETTHHGGASAGDLASGSTPRPTIAALHFPFHPIPATGLRRPPVSSTCWESAGKIPPTPPPRKRRTAQSAADNTQRPKIPAGQPNPRHKLPRPHHRHPAPARPRSMHPPPTPHNPPHPAQPVNPAGVPFPPDATSRRIRHSIRSRRPLEPSPPFCTM